MMKKYIFYTLAIAAAMTGCSSEENIAEQQFEASNDQVMVNIMAPSLEKSRATGTGTVGSTDPTKNTWEGQTVRLFMFNKGTLDLTKLEDLDGKTLVPVFDNRKMVAPKGTDLGAISRPDKERSFYPIKGASDFWAYHTGGAEQVGADGKEVVEYNVANVAVPFVIDGSQDLMVAKTNESIITNMTAAEKQQYLYSAHSARKFNVTPQLDFKHLLTRLTFSVSAYEEIIDYSEEAGWINEDQIIINNDASAIAADLDFAKRRYNRRQANLGVYVDSIMIQSATTGKIIVAYTAADVEKQQKIVWTPGTEKFLTLKERQVDGKGNPLPAEKMETMERMIVPRKDIKSLGEALLVKPSEKYYLRVAMHQYKEKTVTENNVTKKMYYRRPVVWPGLDAAPQIISLSDLVGKGAAGYSYNIHLRVSGLEEIKLDGMLTPWNQGGTTVKPMD